MIDITDSSSERMKAGIEHLLEGGIIAFHEVSFRFVGAANDRSLLVTSWSDYDPDRVTKDMAMEKIQRSKSVGEELARVDHQFCRLWTQYPRIFDFCWDYGKGGICIASERDGQLEWNLTKAQQDAP